MLSPDELAAIPIFSTLSPVALADVARAAGDGSQISEREVAIMVERISEPQQGGDAQRADQNRAQPTA